MDEEQTNSVALANVNGFWAWARTTSQGCLQQASPLAILAVGFIFLGFVYLLPPSERAGVVPQAMDGFGAFLSGAGFWMAVSVVLSVTTILAVVFAVATFRQQKSKVELLGGQVRDLDRLLDERRLSSHDERGMFEYAQGFQARIEALAGPPPEEE